MLKNRYKQMYKQTQRGLSNMLFACQRASQRDCASQRDYFPAFQLHIRKCTTFVHVCTAVVTGILTCGLSACAPQIPAESNDILQRSKEVTQDSPLSKQALRQTAKPWRPDARYLPEAKEHQSQVVDIFQLAHSNDGALQAVSIDNSGKVLLWMLSLNKPYELYSLSTPGDSYALSADQRLLAVAQGTTVSLHSLPEHRPLEVFHRLPTRVNALAFHPFGGSVLIAGVDGKVYRWKYLEDDTVLNPSERNKPFERYLGHSTVVSSMAFHPHGRFFLSGDWKGRLRAWLLYDSDLFEGEYDENIFEGKFFSEGASYRVAPRSDTDRIDFIQFSHDGNFFVLGTGSGNIELWSLRGFKRQAVVQAYRGVIKALAYNSTTGQVITYGRNGFLKVWNIAEREDEVLGEKFYEFVLSKESRIPNLSMVRFVSKNVAVAGSEEGAMMLIQLDKLTDVAKKDVP
ncbi:MAG: hypothetical protein KDD55_08215 [Bdellovibrionales bacterium]|nr:hypothetical protein [Bdellovibrionales bacterium]